MRDLLEGVAYIFENYLFVPFNYLKALELKNWWAASTVSWIFIIIGFVAFIYWMRELNNYNKTEPEDKSMSAHSYM
ncbi:hypothetical protein NBRC110019_19260 [Neptunitalea chrysea]|uniref:Uracil phosphoribosyltransferase n=1 Tax=Neptunitalea chrysea TaxID=1647581 RepID=A0A9W6B5G8_9FLAO|nr:uracil phosphoribosyltransferase [Neptunitalea chrysea]GLB52886.1 hypothetical protein NBRC110019_19260 [Neptunitalea chrysea]